MNPAIIIATAPDMIRDNIGICIKILAIIATTAMIRPTVRNVFILLKLMSGRIIASRLRVPKVMLVASSA